MITTNTKYIYISTVNRASGNPGSFSITIHPDSCRSKDYEVMRLNLDELTIGRQWSEIIEGVNDTIVFTDENDDETTYTIPDENYTAYSFRDKLNSLLTGKYTITYNASTNRYTFTASNSAYKLYALNTGQFLGLNADTDYQGTFTSEYPINLTYINTIYLNSDITSNSQALDNIKNANTDSSTILARIPVDVPPNSNIIWKNLTDNNGIKLHNLNLNSINFWLTTDKNTRLTLNNDFDFCLRVNFIC